MSTLVTLVVFVAVTGLFVALHLRKRRGTAGGTTETAPCPRCGASFPARDKLCPACGNFVGYLEKDVFCMLCGERLTDACPQCHEPIIYPIARFCPSCGEPLVRSKA